MSDHQRPHLLLAAAAAVGLYYWFRQGPSDPPTAKEVGTTVRWGLLGPTTTRDFVAETRAALAGESSFLAARVTRAYVHTETIHRSILGFVSDATLVVTYSADYPVGFDLRSGAFNVAEEGGVVTVTLAKPHLVASAAVRLLSHDIPDLGLFVDEETALAELHERIQPMVQRRAVSIEQEPAVIAQCELALGSFLSTLLARHGPPPTVRFAYR